MMGLHRDEAVGGKDRGVKEDREGQEDQQCKDGLSVRAVRTQLQAWVVCCTSSNVIAEERSSFWMDGWMDETRCLECKDNKLGVRSRRLV